MGRVTSTTHGGSSCSSDWIFLGERDLQPSSHVLVKPPDEVPARADADDVPATKDVDKTFAEKRSAEAAGMTTAVLPLGRLSRRGETLQLVGHA